jgi:hypothetical protein
MPQGYYTVERWTESRKDTKAEWTAIFHLPFGQSLTAAEKAIEKRNQPGFYRVIHMQRVIWAEKDADKLRLRKSHAGSPESLDSMRQMFERTDGRYPIEEVREARRQAKNKK